LMKHIYYSMEGVKIEYGKMELNKLSTTLQPL